jgi:hypothetical protein
MEVLQAPFSEFGGGLLRLVDVQKHEKLLFLCQLIYHFLYLFQDKYYFNGSYLAKPQWLALIQAQVCVHRHLALFMKNSSHVL